MRVRLVVLALSAGLAACNGGEDPAISIKGR